MMTHTTTADTHDSSHDHVHALPLWLLFSTFAALIVLTLITVTASKLELGVAEIWVAMGIATVKAVLVGLYFMHLRYDKPFNGLLLLFSVVFAAIFVGLSLADSQAYQPELNAYEAQQTQ